MVFRKNLLVLAVAVLAVTLVAVPAVSATRNDGDHKIGICHATGSQTNPYVFIRVDKHATNAHKNHQDGRDVIGANSKADCPKAAVVASAQTVVTGEDESKTQKESKKTQEFAAPTELPKAGPASLIAGVTAISTLGYATSAYLRSRKLV
jgi:hypothetical protein